MHSANWEKNVHLPHLGSREQQIQISPEQLKIFIGGSS